MNSPVVHLKRIKPSIETRLHLFTRAGGRCEFDNCNKYLLEHHVTKANGNFAEMAHIVAFSKQGPRGQSDYSQAERNDLANLMLLCPTCHKHIDDNPTLYPVDVLISFKRAHESRIHMLTSTKPDKLTVAIVMRAMIGTSHVSVPIASMQQAVAPLYLDPREVFDIDLTHLSDTGAESYWATAKDVISERTTRFFEQKLDSGPLRHISVFALAPIPLLICLGANMSNKIPTALFQRHRDTQEWTWKQEGEIVSFQSSMIREGGSNQEVALILPVSGSVSVDSVLPHIDDRTTIYEIAPAGISPSLQLLRLEQDLRSYRDCYMGFLRQVANQHPNLQNIHVFPALPAPAAVATGFDLMPKCDPALTLYDFRKDKGGFIKTLEVNSHDTQ